MEMDELHAALAAIGARLAWPRMPDAAPARVPVRFALESFAQAERQLGDALVGLHAGVHVKPRGALVHLILSSASLGQGLASLVRFGRLLIDAMQLRFEAHASAPALEFRFDDPTLAAHRQLVDYCLRATCSVLRAAIGPEFALQAVDFAHDATRVEREEYRRVFACPVRFRRCRDALVFESAQLAHAPQVANPLVAEQMEKLAVALTAELRRGLGWRERVGARVRTTLVAGRRAERGAIAQQLGVSVATLIRRLAGEQTSFKDVRDGVVWDLALALLGNPALKLEAIALSVGFGDLAAFSKAFKRRMGTSPAHYRRARRV